MPCAPAEQGELARCIKQQLPGRPVLLEEGLCHRGVYPGVCGDSIVIPLDFWQGAAVDAAKHPVSVYGVLQLVPGPAHITAHVPSFEHTLWAIVHMCADAETTPSCAELYHNSTMDTSLCACQSHPIDIPLVHAPWQATHEYNRQYACKSNGLFPLCVCVPLTSPVPLLAECSWWLSAPA